MVLISHLGMNLSLDLDNDYLYTCVPCKMKAFHIIAAYKLEIKGKPTGQ